MPRTKYSRKLKTTNDSSDDYNIMMKNFDRQVQLRITKLERDAQTEIKTFETFVNVVLSRLPTEIRQKTLSDILNWEIDNQKENYNEKNSSEKNLMQPPIGVPKTTKKLAIKKRGVTAASDDGYVTEGGTSVDSTSHATRAQVTTTIRTRSSNRTSRAKLSEINQKIITRARSKDRSDEFISKKDNFKTPGLLKRPDMYNVVTPKVKPNTPLNVLRRPRQGEMVLSMQGSPLLVSAVVEERTANINVPLSNGNVMSLLPQEGLRMSNIPPLDPETMHQLKTLKNHIEKVIGLE